MTTIDHVAYPHIVDLILQHADPRTQLAFTATCRLQRRRVSHVALNDCEAPRSSRNTTRGLSRFAGFSLDEANRARSRDYCPPLVTVLDLGGRTATFCPPESSLGRSLHERRLILDTIRRASPAAPLNLTVRESRARLPIVRTIVDYIDLNRVPDCHHREINLTTCRKRHILHLCWTVVTTDISPPYKAFHFVLPESARLRFTLVLWPLSQRESSASRDRIRAFIESLCYQISASRNRIRALIESRYSHIIGNSITVVAPAADYLKLTFTAAPIKYMSYDDWLARLGDESDALGAWIPRTAVEAAVSLQRGSEHC